MSIVYWRKTKTPCGVCRQGLNALTIQTWKARVSINSSFIHPFNIVAKLSKVSLVAAIS